jgi:predicted kinase
MDLTRFHELNIILLCGLYGSGKTEFAIRHFMGKDRSRISRSEIRKYMFEMTHFGEKWSATDFTDENEALVKHIERKVLEHFIYVKRKVLIINTFVTKKSRKRFVDIAREHKKTIGAIFLSRPLDQCIERNEQSTIGVPGEVVTSLFYKIEPPEKGEGFDEVLVVNIKTV